MCGGSALLTLESVGELWGLCRCGVLSADLILPSALDAALSQLRDLPSTVDVVGPLPTHLCSSCRCLRKGPGVQGDGQGREMPDSPRRRFIL